MVNFFSGLENFIASWDDIKKYNLEKDEGLPFVKGEQGSINSDGSLSCIEASIFSKNSPRFRDVIETGVKSLVLYLVDSMNLITYTSCEGHVVDLKNNIFKYRDVGLLPRNLTEYERLKKKLQFVESRVNEIMTDSLVKVVINETFVDSEISRMPCIDILFLPKQGQEKEYFIYLEEVYQKFVEFVSSES